MNYLSMQQIFNGFVEAMYFMEGADFKDEDGFYLDGKFNSQYDLSNQARININLLIETIIPKLPDSIYDLTLDRIGNHIYYEIQGYEGFSSDELDLSDEDKDVIYQLFFNSVFLEIYDNEDTQEIEFSYTENWN